jgi:hypothetical protein
MGNRPTWGTCGAPRTVPTIHGVRLTNQGKEVLRFSKFGLYLQLSDATGDRVDWLERNKAKVLFYTNGLVDCKGDMIDMTTPTPLSYATVSREHYVALPAETSLVLDLNEDVPLAAVRLGAVESNTAPEQRKLFVETSASYRSISDATFTAGFVRGLASRLASHLGLSGIYEYLDVETLAREKVEKEAREKADAYANILLLPKTLYQDEWGYPRYVASLPLADALKLWDTTLGDDPKLDRTATLGFYGRMRDPTLNRLMFWVYTEVERGIINFTGRFTWTVPAPVGRGPSTEAGVGVPEPASFPIMALQGFGNANGGTQYEYKGNPSKQFDFIRWGYTVSVRPTRLYFNGSSGGTMGTATIELRGYPNRNFNDSESDLLFKGAIAPTHNPGKAYNLNAWGGWVSSSTYDCYVPFIPNSNTIGWMYYQVKNTSSDTAGFNGTRSVFLLAQ